MQELIFYMYSCGVLAGLLAIVKGFRILYKNWKVKQLNKILHASKRKNGRSVNTHK